MKIVDDSCARGTDLMMKTSMTWQGGLKFRGTGQFGHTIVTDGSRQAGGEEDGHKPTELLLFGIAGCTGIDVIRILEKQRQKVTALEIEVIAHQPEEYPRPFNRIEVKYHFRGENLDPKKVAMAIELSESKYCAVSQTVSCSGEIATSFDISEE
jgi:putative redox protein